MQGRQHQARQHPRASRRGRFAGLQAGGNSQDDSAELYVLGLPCTLFRDDDAASTIEAEQHLVPWQGDYSTLVDRFDVRLLLEKLEDRQVASSRQQHNAAQEEEERSLDAERYGDLDYDLEWQLGGTPGPHQLASTDDAGPSAHHTSTLESAADAESEEPNSNSTSSGGESGSAGSDTDASTASDGFDTDEDAPLPPPPRPATAAPSLAPVEDQTGDNGRPDSPVEGGYQAVGFQYDYGEVEQEEKHDDAQVPKQHTQPMAALPLPGPPYRPPFDFPAHVRVWPENEQLDKVVRETARFVRRGGGQVEVLLRVKQAGNPMFGFLQPVHPIHAYYAWIVKDDPQEVPTSVQDANGSVAASDAGALAQPQPSELARSDSWLMGIQYSDTEDSRPSSPAASARSTSIGSQDVPQHGPHLPADHERDSTGGHEHESTADLEQESGVLVGAVQQRAQEPQQGQQPAQAQQEMQQAQIQHQEQQQEQAQHHSTHAAAVGGAEALPEGSTQQLSPLPPLSPELAAVNASAQPKLEVPAAAEEGAAGINGSAAMTAVAGSTFTAASGTSVDTHNMMLVINRLVGFVKRSGAKFEATVRLREANNPAFAFLQPMHPHHKLYREALGQAMGSNEAADALLAESIDIAESKMPKQQQAAGRSSGSSQPAAAASEAAAAAVSAPLVLALAKAAPAAAATLAAPAATAAQPALVYGPEKKPLVLKANRSALTGQQAMRIAARQAAALIAQQAAAAKAAPATTTTAAAAAGKNTADAQQSLQQAVLQAARVMATKREAMLSAAAAEAPPQFQAEQHKLATVVQQDNAAEQGGSTVTSAPAASGAADATGDSTTGAQGPQADAAGAVESAEEKLLQRRMRARALLAQKMEEKRRQEEEQQRQEAAARAQAVASHRQALLRAMAEHDELDSGVFEPAGHPAVMQPHMQQPHATSAAQHSYVPSAAAPAASTSTSETLDAPGASMQPGVSRLGLSPAVTVAMHKLVMLRSAQDEDLSLLDELEELEEGELRDGPQQTGLAGAEQHTTEGQQEPASLVAQTLSGAPAPAFGDQPASASAPAVVREAQGIGGVSSAPIDASTLEVVLEEPAVGPDLESPAATGAADAQGQAGYSESVAVQTADEIAQAGSEDLIVDVEGSADAQGDVSLTAKHDVTGKQDTTGKQDGLDGAVVTAASTGGEPDAGIQQAAGVEQTARMTDVDAAAAPAGKSDSGGGSSSSSSSSSDDESSSSSSSSESDMARDSSKRKSSRHRSSDRPLTKERHGSKDDKELKRSSTHARDRDRSRSKHSGGKRHKSSRSDRGGRGESPGRSRHKSSKHRSSSAQRKQHHSSSRDGRREGRRRADDHGDRRSERKRRRHDRSASPTVRDRGHEHKRYKAHKERKERGTSSVKAPLISAAATVSGVASEPVVAVPVGESIVLQPASVMDTKPPVSGSSDDLRQRLRSLMGQKLKL